VTQTHALARARTLAGDKTSLDEGSVRRRDRDVSKVEYSPDSGGSEVMCLWLNVKYVELSL